MVYRFVKDEKRVENVIEGFLAAISKMPEQGDLKPSFDNGYLLSHEGYKKRDMLSNAYAALDVGNWNPAMVRSGEIARRSIAGMRVKSNNLVHFNQKTLFENRLKDHPSEAGEAIYTIFCSKDEEKINNSIETLCDLVGRRYDILSYLLYLSNPNRFLPCKPAIMHEAFDILGVDPVFLKTFTYKNYIDYNLALREIAEIFTRYTGHIDLIDAHSFAWVLSRYEDVRAAIFEKEDLAKKKERDSKVKARVNQTEFRKNLLDDWDRKCAVTGCELEEVLIASHIKPWRDCELNSECVSKYNGLLLTPNLDALFDAGLISFDSKGEILISPLIPEKDRRILGVAEGMRLRKMDKNRDRFMEYHRTKLFQA